MPDDLFPIQFIEGINESGKTVEQERFLSFHDYGFALPYSPTITYTLVRVDIFGTAEMLDSPVQHKMNLHTDYEDNPSDICLASGMLTVPEDNGKHWFSVILSPNVAVIKNRIYWMVFPENPIRFRLGLSYLGQEIPMRGNLHGIWKKTTHQWRLKVRFYGRVIPIYN